MISCLGKNDVDEKERISTISREIVRYCEKFRGILLYMELIVDLCLNEKCRKSD